jgi:16S rRNA processing protein RimM
MKALPLADSFYSLAPENTVILGLPSGISEAVRIRSLKKQNKHALISFYGVNDPETALKYRGAILGTDNSRPPALRDGEYLCEQLIGLTVLTTEGAIIGRLSKIFETGSNDVYVVDGPGKEYLIPAIHDVIAEICLEEGKIIIRAIEGLLD